MLLWKAQKRRGKLMGMYGCIVLCGHEVMDFYICDVCGWQNTDINNVDGGPNHMTLEGAKKAYADGREIN